MRKHKIIASIAIMAGLLGMCGVQTATASEDKPIEVTSIRFTGENHMAYSFNTLRVDWTADNPHSGQKFTISLPDTLIWGSELSYPLSTPDAGQVGTCVSSTTVLTCTFDQNVDKYSSIKGFIEQSASIRETAVGEKYTKLVTSSGDFIIDFPDKVVEQRDIVYAGTYKFGWAASKNAQGLIQYGWWIYSDKGVTRSVVDEGASPDLVQCANTRVKYWGDDGTYRPELVKTEHSVSWEVRNATDVCRSKFFSESTESKVTNTATVNGETVSYTVEYAQKGSGSADGDNKPSPQPNPDPEPTPTPEPQPVPESVPNKGEKTDKTVPVAPKTVKTAQKSSEKPVLAHTGVNITLLGVVSGVIFMVACSLFLVKRNHDKKM